ncbi:MAG: helix-turn-helix domain-containing protein [Planctomycetes bacterium]|nr:helix-turn-helix domain-containing protein [Planctomycetota bacterium]
MSDTDKLAQLLGEHIRAVRRKMRMKQAGFAHLVGTSEDTIGLIERGKILPRLETLYKISVSLNIPLPKLLDFGKDITPKNAKSTGGALSSLNLYLKTKSPKQVRIIHDIAQNIFDTPAV